MNSLKSKKSTSMLANLMNLKLKTQFALLLMFVIISFLLAGAVGNISFSKVLVNGPVYSKIVSNKDLVADILPPPAYLLESWQVALEMTAIKNQSPLPLIEKSKQLEADFLTRTKYWDDKIADPKMHEVIKTQLQPSGIEYLRILDNNFIPAIRSGNPKLIDQALADLKSAYEKHRKAVDILSGLADEQSKVIETGVIDSISVARQTVIIIALLALVLILGVIVMMMRSITKPLNKSIQVFTNIESGNFNTPIEADGDNELSKVLQSLDVMQSKLSKNIGDQQALAAQVAERSELYERQLAAISRSTGVIEFSLDGKVIAVNDIFLKALGYSQDEVIGQPHSKFVDEKYRGSLEYNAFWEKLNRGEAVTGEFERVGKHGKEVWLQASYNPILDATGKPYKVVKYATDITEQKIRNSDFESQMTAIGRSQGIVEIGLDGKLLKANDIYLNMLGYTEKELIGQPSSIVLDPNFAKSAEFKTLWDKLVKGGSDAGQYKRIAKNGKEVWIQASYNPIYDLHGKPYKIVNYTLDITAQKLQAADNAGQLAAIDKIQGVIEFDLTGKITAVNANFASAVGYSENEIVGKHHSMFVETTYRSSNEYKVFWDNLAKGEAQFGQFKRIGKGGKEVWMQASYNPIMDINGKPFKVVKYATDITEQYKNAASLSEAVEETQGIIESAKDGDLSSRVSLDGKTGAIASLCEGVNALMSQMTDIIVQVREAGETINTAAGEIAAGNNDLSSRTEQQASSLEETAASMEQLASTVKNNAENAKQANQLSIAASGIAVKGGSVVSEVVATMSAINASSKKIEDIISVIDGIAFQTNILALNAAVEAARAGEQGRGFAVVAGEVRNLAQRSASAAKEIKELIHDSVGKTAEGTQQVETAGNTMHEIVSSVQRVTDIMAEITAASLEQSAGIDQVNQAVTSMDEVTQQNAALVEEAAAAAESLVEQAESLIETVRAFKLIGANSRATTHLTAKLITNKPVLRAISK
jgi:methyl-accepting chemotaxis protein